jgi:preprotein translocase subunit SecD
MLRTTASLLAVIALLTACAGTPDSTQEGDAPVYSGNPDIQFRLLAAENGPFANLNAGEYPPGHTGEYQWLELAHEDTTGSELMKERDGRKYIPVRTTCEYDLTGAHTTEFRPVLDLNENPAILIKISDEGRRRLDLITTNHGHQSSDPRRLAIVVQGQVQAVYRISGRVLGDVSFHGSFTEAERDELLRVLRGEHESTED